MEGVNTLPTVKRVLFSLLEARPVDSETKPKAVFSYMRKTTKEMYIVQQVLE